MSTTLADRLLAECRHMRPVADPQLDALRRTVVIEDVLGIRLDDDQIRLETLTDPAALHALGAPDRP